MNIRRGSTGQEFGVRQEEGARDGINLFELGVQRQETARVAQQLSMVAFRNWEKALTGLLALPTAMTAGAAAAALYATVLVERAFEMVEGSMADIGTTVARQADMMRQNGGASRPDFAAEVRGEARANEPRA